GRRRGGGGGGKGGKGVGGGGDFSRHAARRHEPLFDGEDRFAGGSLEHVHHSGLRHLNHDGDLHATLSHGRQRGGRRVVVIPDVVVRCLKVPDYAAGGGAQRNDGIRVAVLAEPHATEVIGRGTRRRQEDQIASGIGHNHRPHVAAPGARGTPPLPGLERGIRRILRDGIERPLERAGPNIPRAHLAARGGEVRVVRDGRAGNDQASHDRGRRGHLVEHELVRL